MPLSAALTHKVIDGSLSPRMHSTDGENASQMGCKRRLAILHDSKEFGGHETAFLSVLPGLLASSAFQSVTICVPAENHTFISKLTSLSDQKLTIVRMPYAKLSSDPLRAPLRFRYGLFCRRFVRTVCADVVLLLQGRIENLATPMLWLPRSIPVVSYIPMAHTSAQMGRSLVKGWFSDRLKRLYYRRPNRFIVVSQAVAAQARSAGARAPIFVVENVAPATRQSSRTKGQARNELGLAQSGRIALFMGRFDEHQKGLDLIIRDLRRDGERLGDWTFVFVGQGPAETELRSLLAEGLVRGWVVGWTDDPTLYLSASDVLLLPSRFEGVPLVMLEAMQATLPILSADIDVFREYLPSIMRRDFSEPVDVASALNHIDSPVVRELYKAHNRSLLARLSLETAQTAFVSALLDDKPSER